MGHGQLFRLELKRNWHGECEKKLQKHKLFSCGLAVMFKEKGESESESVDDFLGGTEGSLEYSAL